MPWTSRLCPFPLAAIALLAGIASPAAAAKFPEITAEERALTAVPDHPNASAVVLFRKGHFTMMESGDGEIFPVFTVQVRRKVLTEEGKRYGEFALEHRPQVRLLRLEGRTVLPDGRVLPLPKEAIFKRRISKAEEKFVTSFALPSVEVGAILDYEYELEFAQSFLGDFWSFQEEIPTLHSEMVYEIPRELRVSSYLQDPLKVGIQQSTEKIRQGLRIVTWGKNLPAVPKEPYGLDPVDVTSLFMLLPLEFKGMNGTVPFFKDWSTTCGSYVDNYERALKRKGAAERKARELAASGSPRERAEALYRFVRDEIVTEDDSDVFGIVRTPEEVLAERWGNPASKALLLQAMLQAAGVPARPVWAANRFKGLVNLEFATPQWFTRVLAVAEIDGRLVFLDPSDRRLAFGRLAPGFEEMPALIVDRNPQPIALPASPFDEHQRLARIQMDLDAGGRLSGQGTLDLSGHHAWARLYWKDDAAQTAEAWKDWLTGRFKGFAISEVRVREAVDERKVEVTWSMVQHEGEVLGNEATLVPSRPFGPAVQLFHLPAASRLTPVLFGFADREHVVLLLRWPEGWKPEARPSDTQTVNSAGVLQTQVTVNEAERSLLYQRRLEIRDRFVALPQYGMIRSLFNHTEKNDAQALVLVRRPD
jgi:hypothetical protein